MAAKITNEDKIWSKMTIREKVCCVVQNITVEPLMAFFILPSVILRLAVQNLYLEKACRVNLNYSKEVCDALTIRNTTYFKLEEMRVQETVAEMTIWMSFLHSVIPAILIIFLGSWSDRRGQRKLCMLMPFIGELWSVIGLILCVYFFYQLSMEVTGFVHSFLPAITGGRVTMFMGTFSYLTEITNAETRTFRIGAVHIFCSASAPFAMAVAGILIKNLGFYVVFLMAIVGFALGFIYGFYRIKDNKAPYTNVTDTDKNKLFNRKNSSTIQSKYHCMDTVKEFFNDLFNPQNVLDTFYLLFKRRPGTYYKRILVLMIVLTVVSGPIHGEMTVLYLFMRYRFNWDEVQFSIFSTYSVVTHLIGTSFSVGVFSHLLKIDDALIGVMSCISKILAGFVYAFARTEWQVYLAPLVDIVNGTSFIAMRSIASKLVPPEELGKLNSLYGACEALTPLLYGPMYAFVYSHTMDTMPGAFFLLGGALTMPAVVIFGWMYTQHRGDRLEKATSRKSSMAEDVIRNLRVESLAVTPSFQTSDTDPAPHAEGHGGEVNMAFEDNKT